MEKQKTVHISFLIVTYKSDDELLVCIQNIRRVAQKSSYEILIGYNHKGDSILTGDDIYSIYNEKNIGFGAAHNILARHANGKILFFINPDTHTFSEGILNITHDINDDVGIIAPQVRSSQNIEEKWSYGKHLTPLRLVMNNLFSSKGDQEIGAAGTYDVDWVSGAAFLMSKKLFESVGGFDEQFFLYYEDVDLCRRVKRINYRIVRDTQYHICHISGSSNTSKKQQKQHYYKSQYLFFQKYYGIIIAKVLRFFQQMTHTS